MDLIALVDRFGLSPKSQKSIKLSWDIEPVGPPAPLGFTVEFNGEKQHVWQPLTHSQHCEIPIHNDQAATHTLQFMMWGKTQQHTKVADTGEYSRDSLIRVSNFCLDDVDVTELLMASAIYVHDFNGLARCQYQVEFHGDMGCNGWVRMTFDTPYYDWLLQKL